MKPISSRFNEPPEQVKSLQVNYRYLILREKQLLGSPGATAAGIAAETGNDSIGERHGGFS
jgi:uncharacterized protein (DUF2062 family)